MIVVMRFDDVVLDADPHSDSDLKDRLVVLLAGLADSTGYERGWIGRSPDEPTRWTVVTVWDGAGQFRRALSGFEVKLALGSLASESVDLPSVFETVVASSGGEVTQIESSRSPDADTVGPGAAL